MLLRLTGIQLSLDEDETLLPQKAAVLLSLKTGDIDRLTIVRKSLDARKKNSILYIYTILVDVPEEKISPGCTEGGNVKVVEKTRPSPFPKINTETRPVIIGTGPAGLFAALRLSEYGVKPLILERGKPVGERVKDVESFWNDRKLNPESNVQFGEGGAGTFSDGKLTTRVDDPRIAYILKAFIDAGAEPEIAYLAKPHIGTDRLRAVIVNLRKFLIDRGCEVRFNSKVSAFNTHNGVLKSVIINGEEDVFSDKFIIAIGHSARDSYEALLEAGVSIEPKAFAVGLRVEHPQPLINSIQYGTYAGHPKLPAAEYVLSHNMKARGRSAYSFCMCPGGTVVNASSEPGGLVVNGMSQSGRDSGYANSALVVTVSPDDFGSGPLSGVAFQRNWEKTAFIAGGGNYSAPAQNLLSFIGEGGKSALNRSGFLPGLADTDLAECIPEYIAAALREAIPVFGRKMKGFVSAEAMLIGVETRSSAPVRIRRDESGQSVSTRGLYPCGEGAGYAGGIISSALDGIKIADKIAENMLRSASIPPHKLENRLAP